MKRMQTLPYIIIGEDNTQNTTKSSRVSEQEYKRMQKQLWIESMQMASAKGINSACLNREGKGCSYKTTGNPLDCPNCQNMRMPKSTLTKPSMLSNFLLRN